MPRKKPEISGKRATIYIQPRHLKLWKEIENKGGFVNLALDDAVGIMQWAIMKKMEPKKYHIDRPPAEEVVPEFNKEFPLDELTAKRLGKTNGATAHGTNQGNSPKPNKELW